MTPRSVTLYLQPRTTANYGHCGNSEAMGYKLKVEILQKIGADEGNRTLDIHLGKKLWEILSEVDSYSFSLTIKSLVLIGPKRFYTVFTPYCGKGAATKSKSSLKSEGRPLGGFHDQV